MKTRLNRSFTYAASTVFLGAMALLTLSQRHDARAAEQKKPVSLSPTQSKRLKELAQTKGISTAEAMAALRNEAATNGPKLYEQNCADCHRFTDAKGKAHGGDDPSAPDLTGLGSAKWIAGIIKNPEHERFYGSNNDGMPAHFESEDDPLMTQEEIDTLVDYLRGTWEAKKLPPQ